MLDSILGAASGSITIQEILLCTLASLIMGLIVAFVYMFRNEYTKNFVITLALLPVIVQSVIMVVNGNLGTGVAVMGAFSLVRFRSAPGGAKEITCIFFAMAAGLAAGMGYVLYAGLFTIVTAGMLLILTAFRFGEKDSCTKQLRITVPEDLEYTHAFDDLFSKYTVQHKLERARTTNMGSLYELKYSVTLKDRNQEKEFLDCLRQRNGNLSIVCAAQAAVKDEL
ncbi:DUF4956 domain-containing protein [Christensenellaceae bacterium OttesenSCG-928-M15]|nr:DUF4956 domain-containing protein [Christensenellaceae bacterium OttesenSCG-928-M15]